MTIIAVRIGSSPPAWRYADQAAAYEYQTATQPGDDWVWNPETQRHTPPTPDQQTAAARVLANQRITAGRDADLAGFEWSNPTGTHYYYSLARRHDYTAGLDRLRHADQTDPGGVPHSLQYTVIVDPLGGPGDDISLVASLPAGVYPVQVPHDVDQLNVLLDHGQVVIEAVWAKWHAKLTEIAAAPSVADVEAISW